MTKKGICDGCGCSKIFSELSSVAGAFAMCDKCLKSKNHYPEEEITSNWKNIFINEDINPNSNLYFWRDLDIGAIFENSFILIIAHSQEQALKLVENSDELNRFAREMWIQPKIIPLNKSVPAKILYWS